MRDIKELEHHGDRLTHELVDLINRTFVTPFDRDDMYRLAGVLDDICDHVDDSAEKIVGYGVREMREQARAAGGGHPARGGQARRGDRAARGLQGLEAPADRAARARGRGRPHRAGGDRRALQRRRRRDRAHPLEGHPRAARGSRRRAARTPPTCSRRFSSRTVEQTRPARRRRRRRARLRLHERLPRHRELRRDLGRHARALAALGRARLGRREPRRRVRHDRGREDRRQGDHRHRPRDREDRARGARRRDRLEPPHVVARPAVELDARADRRSRRRRARPVGLERRPVARASGEKVVIPGASPRPSASPAPSC